MLSSTAEDEEMQDRKCSIGKLKDQMPSPENAEESHCCVFTAAVFL